MERKYFKKRSGELYTKYTKEEIYSKINPYDWNTILPWLEEFDYAPWKSQYFQYLKILKEDNKDTKYAFGKFIAFMRLYIPRQYGFKDGDIYEPKDTLC